MRVLLLCVVALLVTACGGTATGATGPSDEERTAELREALRVHYEFEDTYDGLGAVTVQGGEARVDTEAWHDPAYGAYLYCSWVENWVRRDQNDPDMDIVVIMGGREILRARGASETCQEAEPQV